MTDEERDLIQEETRRVVCAANKTKKTAQSFWELDTGIRGWLNKPTYKEFEAVMKMKNRVSLISMETF